MTNRRPLAVPVVCPLGLLVNNFMLENVQAKLDLPHMFLSYHALFHDVQTTK